MLGRYSSNSANTESIFIVCRKISSHPLFLVTCQLPINSFLLKNFWNFKCANIFTSLYRPEELDLQYLYLKIAISTNAIFYFAYTALYPLLAQRRKSVRIARQNCTSSPTLKKRMQLHKP